MTSPTVVEDNHLIDLFAKLHLSIDTLSKKVQRQIDDEQKRLAGLPNYIALGRMSTPGAAVTDIQDFGGPQPGRQWVVRLLVAVASPLAANASVVSWYVGQVMPGPAAGMLPATMTRWQFPSVPGFQNFTADVVKLFPNEHLIAGLTGIPASSSIALIAAINDEPLYAATHAVAIAT